MVKYGTPTVHKMQLTFLFPTMHLLENTQRYHETHSVLLLISTTVMAVKAVCKDCNRVFGCDSNPFL
jgi:hypothetical protein